jgi:outer membrane protein assembly factor BamB
MGANYLRQITPMFLDGQMLYLQDAAGKVIALDKTTGSTVWTTPTSGYSRSFHVANNLLYIIDPTNNFNALNLATGALMLSWTTTMNTSVLARPYPQGGNLYFTGIDIPGNNFITSYNALTTSVNWRKNTATFVESPLVTGNTMYTVERDFTTGAKTIFMYDSNTGNYQDAMPLTPFECGDLRIISASGKFIYPY